jgi:DNA-binding response OmpR family regulator
MGVWVYNDIPIKRTIDIHVAWLRRKMKEDNAYPLYIRTVRKYGYKFMVD